MVPPMLDADLQEWSIQNMRIQVVTPCHNEEAFLPKLVDAMKKQERISDSWIIVDDRSEILTSALLVDVASSIDWIKYIRKSSSPLPDEDASFQSFQFGLQFPLSESDNFDLIMKLDADTLLPENYFRTMIKRFEEDLCLGIASGICRGEVWDKSHPRGNNRIYRPACLKQIPFPESGLGWDTVDEIFARKNGWNVRAFPDVVVEHLRPRHNVLSYRYEQGMISNYLGYPLWFSIGRAAKISWQTGLKQGWAYLKGYHSNIYGSASLDIRRMVRKVKHPW